MTRPTPDRRYQGDDLQKMFEAGFAQCYDHDSFRTLDWIEHAVSSVGDEAGRCRRRAALLEGCAAALEVLADRQLESVVLWEDGAA